MKVRKRIPTRNQKNFLGYKQDSWKKGFFRFDTFFIEISASILVAEFNVKFQSDFQSILGELVYYGYPEKRIGIVRGVLMNNQFITDEDNPSF